MIRGQFGFRGPPSRAKIWNHEIFINEFGAQNGELIITAECVDCYDIWVKYGILLRRIVNIAEKTLTPDLREKWGVIIEEERKKADAGRAHDVNSSSNNNNINKIIINNNNNNNLLKNALMDISGDTINGDHDSPDPIRRRVGFGDFTSIYNTSYDNNDPVSTNMDSSFWDERARDNNIINNNLNNNNNTTQATESINKEQEEKHTEFLYSITELLTPELAFKLLPLLSRIIHIINTTGHLFQYTRHFMTWHMHYYLSKVINEINRTAQIILRGPGDFFLLPIVISGGAVSIMLVEFESLEERRINEKERASEGLNNNNKGRGSSYFPGQRVFTLPPRPNEETYCITIFNGNPTTKYHPKTVLKESPEKIKQQVAISIKGVSKAKLFSDAWWSCVFLMPMGLENIFYTHLLTWLTEEPYFQQISTSVNDNFPSTPIKITNQSVLWKTLTYLVKYLAIKKAGVNMQEAKLTRFLLRLALFSECKSDVMEMTRVKAVSKATMQCCLIGTARALVRNEKTMSIGALVCVKKGIEELSSRVESIATDEDHVTPMPPILDITNGWDMQQQHDIYPLMECFRRIESTEHFAGTQLEQPKNIPINMGRIRRVARCFTEALEIIDELLLVVNRIATQHSTVKNSFLLVASAIQETILHSLPTPLGPKTRRKHAKNDGDDKIRCFWSDLDDFPDTKGGIRYAQQLHIIKRLKELTMYYFTSCNLLNGIPEGVVITTFAQFSAIANAIMQIRTIDVQSLFCKHYNGWRHGAGKLAGEMAPYCIDAGIYEEVSSDCNFGESPEALLVRQSVLDYFEEVANDVPPSNVIFRLKSGFDVKDTPTIKLMHQICRSLNIPYAHNIIGGTKDGHHSLLARQCIDYCSFRDIVFITRHIFANGTWKMQNWRWDENVTFQVLPPPNFLMVSYMDMTLCSRPKKHNRSLANPASHVFVPNNANLNMSNTITEDDLLHMPHFNEIGNLCGLRDAELFLSYLTVPYLRIPLVLRFLATEDHASLLYDVSFRQVVSSVLFEPGRFLRQAYSSKCPTMVPAENHRLLSCPYGLLMNELIHNPTGVIDPLCRLVHLILELDAGNISNQSTMGVIQYLSRTVAYVQSYLLMAKGVFTEGKYRHPNLYRDANISNKDAKRAIDEGYATINKLVLSELIPILTSWVDEIESNTNGTMKLDKVCENVSSIMQEILFLLRGMDSEALIEDDELIKMFLSSILFLTTRYTWRKIPVVELCMYTIVHRHRLTVTKHLLTLDPQRLSNILNYVIQSVTRAGQEHSEAADMAANAVTWGIVVGHDCIGRFCRLGEETKGALEKQNQRALLQWKQHNNDGNLQSPREVPKGNIVGQRGLEQMQRCLKFTYGDSFKVCSELEVVPQGLQDVEVNLNTFTVTFKNAHLQQLPDEVYDHLNECDGLIAAADASSYDAKTKATHLSKEVLSSLQCAMVDLTVNRKWARLVAQDADIMIWTTNDPRVPLPSCKSLRFYPDELTSIERWIHDIFEPVRQRYFERSFWEPPIFILLQGRKLTADNSVAMVSAVDSASGKKLKECYIFRDYGVVHIYDVFSWGRRFYRTLHYTSDERFALSRFPVSILPRVAIPPAWAKSECGDPNPDSSHGKGISVLIVRHPFHPLNRSGSRETFLKKDLLRGLIPDALLEAHSFWQDDDDNIRGYPLLSLQNNQQTPQPTDEEKGEESEKKKNSELEKSVKSNNIFGDAAKTVGGAGDEYDDVDWSYGSNPSNMKNPKQRHILWLHWRETSFDAIGEKNTCMRIVRFANADHCPRSSEAAIRRAHKSIHPQYETEADLEEMKKDADVAAEENDPIASEELEAGAFQQVDIVNKFGMKTGRDGGDTNKDNKTSEAVSASIEDEDLLLVNLMYARKGTPLFSLANVITRLETLSSVLVWTRDLDYDSSTGAPLSIDLIYLPNLKLSLSAKLSNDKTEYLLFSNDHAHLYVSNIRHSSLQGLIQGLPYSLVLSDVNDNLSIITPSIKISRPRISSSPLSTYVVPERDKYSWVKDLDTRYYLYPVHVSFSFLFTETMASALYLLLCKILHRCYKDAFDVAGTIGTDIALTKEENMILTEICQYESIKSPLSTAVYARISLVMADAPIEMNWYPPSTVMRYIYLKPHIDVDCHINSNDFRRLLYFCQTLEAKMNIIRYCATQPSGYHAHLRHTNHIIPPAQLALTKIQRPHLQVSNENMAKIRQFYRDIMNKMREEYDSRVTVEEIERLLIIFMCTQVPTDPYFKCLLKNNYNIINSECVLRDALISHIHQSCGPKTLPKTINTSSSGGWFGSSNECSGSNNIATLIDTSDREPSPNGISPTHDVCRYRITIDAYVPELDRELHLITGNDIEERCQLMECRLPNPKQHAYKNKEGRIMKLAPTFPVYYCGMKNCRESLPCECGECDETCGPDGCPCAACRHFNITKGRTIRELPNEMDFSKYQAEYKYFDIYIWIVEVFQSYFNKQVINQKKIYLSEPPSVSLNHGHHFVKMYSFATGSARLKISRQNCALDMAQIMYPLSYDSRCRASGLGTLMNFVVFHPKLAPRFHRLTPKEIRTEKAEKILSNIYTSAIALASEVKQSYGDNSGSSVQDFRESGNVDNSDIVDGNYVTKDKADRNSSLSHLEKKSDSHGDDTGKKEVETSELNVAQQKMNNNKMNRERSCSEEDDDDDETLTVEKLHIKLEKRSTYLQEKLSNECHIPNQGKFELTFTPKLPYRANIDTPLRKTSIFPIPTNTDCGKRLLSVPDMTCMNLLSKEEEDIVEALRSDEAIRELCYAPLAYLIKSLAHKHGDIILEVSRSEQELDPVPSKLPFQLHKHDAARKLVAREMLDRVENDMKCFADQENQKHTPKISGFTCTKEVQEIIQGKETPQSKRSLAILTDLQTKLHEIREQDYAFIHKAFPVLSRTANRLPYTNDDDDETTRRASLNATMSRFSHQEPTLSINYIVASLATKGAEHELMQLNPFLTKETAEAIFNLTTLVVLHVNRVAQINRTCDAISELLEWLDRATSYPSRFKNAEKLQESPSLAHELESYKEAVAASLCLKADAVAEQILIKRCYFSDVGKKEVSLPNGEKFQACIREFDPRFLLFEFTWSLIIRERQREIINEMRDSIVDNNQSVVKQMIMGAGKTTVVGPLLGVMLADGSRLVLQVVPPALLDFTRAVMRTTFSTVMRKQIFTFTCDRSGEVDSEILFKFEHARASRGIMVTTPSSIKSIFLKYIESLDRIADTKRQYRTIDDERIAKNLHRVISMWRNSVVVMDEVDLILHPLKSELNFPVGPKESIDFAPLRWMLPIHILDALFYCSTRRLTTFLKDSVDGNNILIEFREAVEEGIATNALQETPHLTLLNTDFYELKLKPLMAKWIILFIKSQLFIGLSDKDTFDYITRRPGLFSTSSQRDCGRAHSISEKEEQITQEFVKRVSALEEAYIKILNLSFEWLTCYLPHIWKKIDRVSYGIMNENDMIFAKKDNPCMPKSRFVTAIPFVGKDLPSQNSEFAHPDIVIGLTILAYRLEGIRAMDFQEVMSDLYKQVESEVGKYNQRRTSLLFKRWVEASGATVVSSFNYKARQSNNATKVKDTALTNQSTTSSPTTATPNNKLEILPLKLLKQANSVEIAKLFKVFRKTPEVIHFYLMESVFPAFMRHQNTKLSASGQELGGNMLFDRRVGFSGTPSDLLPMELGRCGYEKGTDGQLIHTLTNPDVLSVRRVESGWTVRSLLDFIVSQDTPHRYSALIDTGALITGVSNLQVATYLLRSGLHGRDGVVFLDELDRKMILVRATGRVLKLEECGIPKSRRFAFYDQVHTTGMDISHTPNAIAVQTLGKDMTFRDFSQGAYRMRGIGAGQKVELLVIPEVHDLIYRSLAAVQGGHRLDRGDNGVAESHMTSKKSTDGDIDGNSKTLSKLQRAEQLEDVTAWLLINSMRSEAIQHDQLCIQSCTNVWRKEAFAELTKNIAEFNVNTINLREKEKLQLQQIESNVMGKILLEKNEDEKAKKRASPKGRSAYRSTTITEGLSEESNTSINVFREPVIFSVNNEVPKLMLFSEIVEQLIEGSKELIKTKEGHDTVNTILARALKEDEVASPAVDVQVVQEQEEERDKDEEEEKEQQIEIDKCLDLAYSRDSETQIPWPLSSLSSVEESTQFYPASSFHLYKRCPLDFPLSLFMSRNYFNPNWSGHRRLRNVIMILEWIPKLGALEVKDATSRDYCTISEAVAKPQIERLFKLILEHSEAMDMIFEEGNISGSTVDISGDEKKQKKQRLLKDLLIMALNRTTEQSQPKSHLASIAKGSTAPHSYISIGPEIEKEEEKEWSALLDHLCQLDGDALVNEVHMVLRGNKLRQEEDGRYYVIVSLAEAETLRRVMHLRMGKTTMLPSQQSLQNPYTEAATFSMKASSCGFATIDIAPLYREPRSTYMPSQAYQSMRFFDCDLYYTSREIGLLLRTLHNNPPKIRQAFFQQVGGCRRRMRHCWEKTPVSSLFMITDAYSLLHQRSVGLCVRRFIERCGLTFGEAFMAFNSSHSGLMAPAELWGGLRYCKLGEDKVSLEEVVNFIELVDSTHEGKVHYCDFISALTGSKDDEEGQWNNEEDSPEDTSSPANAPVNNNKRLPEIEPYGSELLTLTMAEKGRQRRAAEAEVFIELENEDKRVMEIIESEDITADYDAMMQASNPVLISDSMTFSYLMQPTKQTQDNEMLPKKHQETSPTRNSNNPLNGNEKNKDDDFIVDDKTSDHRSDYDSEEKTEQTMDSVGNQPHETNDTDEDETIVETGPHTLRPKREVPKPQHTCILPNIAKTCGYKARTSLDIDGASCLQLFTNTTLNIPLRIFKRIIGYGYKPEDDDISKRAFTSYVLSAEVRFPPSGKGLVKRNDERTDKQNIPVQRRGKNTREAKRPDQDDKKLNFLKVIDNQGGTFQFASWMIPMLRSRCISDSYYSVILTKYKLMNSDKDVTTIEGDVTRGEKASNDNSYDDVRLWGQTSVNDGDECKDIIAMNHLTNIKRNEVDKWIDRVFFFLQETEDRGSYGQGTPIEHRTPPGTTTPTRHVLRQFTSLKPIKARIALRVLRNPRPPTCDEDIVGVIHETDHVMTCGDRALNEINGVVFQWVQVKRPFGWVVVCRESTPLKYTPCQVNSCPTPALPRNSDHGDNDNTAMFISTAAAETKMYDTFFDYIGVKLIFDNNGNEIRLDCRREPYSNRIQASFQEPFEKLQQCEITPPTAQDIAQDRDVQSNINGDVEVVNKDSGKKISDILSAEFLSSDVADLKNLIWKAKRLVEGDKVIRNPEHIDDMCKNAKMDDIGIVISVESDTASIRWSDGHDETMMWGQNGVFSLIRVGNADDSDEEEEVMQADGTMKLRIKGGFGGREPNNDDRFLSCLKCMQQGIEEYICNKCNKSKLQPGDWFRCNHCDEFDLCRKCYRAGADKDHDFTDMGALERQQAHLKNSHDEDCGGSDGFDVEVDVVICDDVVAPKHGWGRDLNSVLEEQEIQDEEAKRFFRQNTGNINSSSASATPTPQHLKRLYNWPLTLVGFIGVITAIDRDSKSITIEILPSRNKTLLLKRANFAEIMEYNNKESTGNGDDCTLTGLTPIRFIADRSEVRLVSVSEETGNSHDGKGYTIENPISYSNIFKMLPYAYYLASIFDTRIVIPQSSVSDEHGSDNSGNEVGNNIVSHKGAFTYHNKGNSSRSGDRGRVTDVEPLQPLGSSISAPKLAIIKECCPFVAMFAEKASENIIGPLRLGEQVLLRPSNIVTDIVGATCRFTYTYMNDLHKLYKEKFSLIGASGGTGGQTKNYDDKDKKGRKEDGMELQKGNNNSDAPFDISILFNTHLFPFQMRYSAPLFSIMWEYITPSEKLSDNNDFIKIPFAHGSSVKIRTLSPGESHISFIGVPLSTVGTITGFDTGYCGKTGKKEARALVGWNAANYYGGNAQDYVFIIDLEVVDVGAWYYRNVAPSTHSTGDEPMETRMTPEEKLYYSSFDDGNLARLPDAACAILERGLIDGVRMQRMFIHDDDYDVDLLTGEVRRMNRLAERDPNIHLESVTDTNGDIDLTLLTDEQKDGISKVTGHVTRFPKVQFTTKEKPPAVDDGQTHIVSFVVQCDSDNIMDDEINNNINFVMDGKVVPIQYTGCFNDIEEQKRMKAISLATRLFFSSSVSLCGTSINGYDGRACNIYYVKLDYDKATPHKTENSEVITQADENEKNSNSVGDIGEDNSEESHTTTMLPSSDASTQKKETTKPKPQKRDLLAETIAWHEVIETASVWTCTDCKHAQNSRLQKKCFKCKKLRHGTSVAQIDNESKFKSANIGSREATIVRSRLQGKLKSQYQRELDVIDRAMEELKKKKEERLKDKNQLKKQKGGVGASSS